MKKRGLSQAERLLIAGRVAPMLRNLQQVQDGGRRVDTVDAQGKPLRRLTLAELQERILERAAIEFAVTDDVKKFLCKGEGCGKRISGRGKSGMCNSCVTRERNASLTSEQWSEMARKASAARTPEQRSEAARKASAARTPEQRTRTPEQRSEAGRKASASLTPEQRSERAYKASAARTPEQRSEAGRKAWETRRAKKP